MAQTTVNKTTVNDDWRRWIAENLSLGGDPQGLFGILVANGIDETEAADEMRLALARARTSSVGGKRLKGWATG